MNRKLVLVIAIAAVVILAGATLIPLDVMPGYFNISSAGEEIASGDTVDYADGLKLEMEWQGYEDGMSIDCNLIDIEESETVEVGAFNVEGENFLFWTFTLDDVRNDTNPYKLTLTGDTTGETFTFYIMGEEGEEEGIPDPFVDPIISEVESNNTSPNVGEDIKITFKVETYCNYAWEFKIDGITDDSGIIVSGGDYRLDYLNYVVTHTINGTYTYSLDLEYVDDEGETAFVSDSIDVVWVGVMPDDTDTTTTTETTDTTTTEPPPLEEEDWLLYALAAVIIIAIVLYVKK